MDEGELHPSIVIVYGEQLRVLFTNGI